jgi:hypothetical protein
MKRLIVLAGWITALWLAAGSARAATNVIYFTSTPGSWIGQGQTLTINSVSASRYYSQGAYTNAVILGGGGYELDLVEPNYSLPTPGLYTNVTRWPFMGAGAGMWFSAPGRGDNDITGWFDVLQADYAPDGTVQAFAVNFKQYDELTTANWTQGAIRYNSAIPLPEPASAVALLVVGAPVMLARRQRRR